MYQKFYQRVTLGMIALGLLALGAWSTSAQDSAPSSSPAPAKQDPPADLSGAAKAGEFVNMSDEEVLRSVRTSELDECIAASLKTLAGYQRPDGSFGMPSTITATSSLAGMAFLASGSTPTSGPYAKQIRDVMEFLLLAQDTNTGFICEKNDTNSAIHGHGFATMFLASCYGHLDPRDAKQMKIALDLAVKCSVGGQTRHGGWGYYPDKLTFDEGSTTVCVLQGIRAARDAGISVDKSVIANAMDYLSKTKERVNFRSPKKGHRGESYEGYTFKYSLASGSSNHSWALVAAACSSLNNIGVYSGYGSWDKQSLTRVLHGGMRYLYHHSDDFFERYDKGQHSLDTGHFPYSIFYATQAFWQYNNRTYFMDFFPTVRDHLLKSWRAGGKRGFTKASYGPVYATAFCLLTLQLPYQYLPAFQR
ncbi:MAG: hypothetical protein KDB07_07960 [Planctomycetes bacterium]|nr:hypothetical protein [Planctomycetota bacterium]